MHSYLRIFAVLFLVLGIYFISEALATGRASIKGMKQPILRRDRPREYWFALGITTFIIVVLAWAILTS
jgi:hypothetical protein